VFLTLLVVAGAATNGVNAQDEPDAAAFEAEVVTAPVEFDSSILFHVRGVSSYPADRRARFIAARLEEVAGNAAVPIDSLQIVEREGVAQIVAADGPIATFVEGDARLEQIRLRELATIHLDRIRQAIVAYREMRSPAALKRAALKSIAATFVFALGVAGVLWLARRANHLLTGWLRPHIRAIEFRSFTLMPAETIAGVLRSALGLLRALTVLTIALMYLGYVFAQFPWTRRLSQNLVGFVLRPLQVIGTGIVHSIPDLLFLAVLLALARLALRLLRLFFDSVGRGSVTLAGFDPEWAQPTYTIIRVLVVVLALVVAYPYVPGSGSDAFKGVSIFLGVVLSLGSTSTIANIIAGYMMTYRRAFKVGDRIKIGDTMGDVIETRIQVTHLRSVKNEELIVPNSLILTSEVVNYSSIARTQGLVLHTDIAIGYDTPWRQVEAMLIMAAERTGGLLADRRPFVRLKKLGEFAVNYELNAYCASAQSMGELYTELHRNVLDVFNEHGVQIMTPAYENDPPTPKIAVRKDWYVTPAQ
jgi:small-conductance mechanosensitive channel